MNEAGGGEPKFEVVQPVEGAESTKLPVEQAKTVAETTPGKQPTPAALQLPVVLPDEPDTTAVLPVHDDSVGPPIDSPRTSKLPAADKNLIEKEWVQKAKEIVAETKNDPYKQKSEMSKAKADYIQKRFKKTVKTDDAVVA